MTKRISHKLRQLYLKHGLYSFLYFFLPLLPGYIESRTHLFLAITNKVAGNVDDLEDTIKLLFGSRGHSVYRNFKATHKKLILPTKIFTVFYQENDPYQGIKLLSYVFFDRAQRAYEHSHLFRTNLIKEFPLILSAYKAKAYSQVRERLIQMLASAAIIEQSPEVKCAILDTVLSLLKSTDTTERLRRQYYQNLQFELISQKIKAELAGKATAADPDFYTIHSSAAPHTHLISRTATNTLRSIITHYLGDLAPEVKENAFIHHSTVQNLLFQAD